MNAVPRHKLHFTESNVNLLSILYCFADYGAQEDASDSECSFIDDDDEEDQSCKLKRLSLRSTEAVAEFASFHELVWQGAAYPGACQAAKVLSPSAPDGSEVAVLVPPLTAVWKETHKGTCQVQITYSFALVNAYGGVSTVTQLVLHIVADHIFTSVAASCLQLSCILLLTNCFVVLGCEGLLLVTGGLWCWSVQRSQYVHC